MQRRGSSFWSYGGREQTGSSFCSIGSSSSGTIASTATYTSSASRLSSPFMSTEEDMLLDAGIHDGHKVLTFWWEETEDDEIVKRIRSMVQNLRDTASTADCGIKDGGDMSVLQERWLTEMGVGWVLHLADAVSAGERDYASDARGWFRALAEIIKTINFVSFSSPVRGSVGLPSICETEPEAQSGKQASRPDQIQIAKFFQQTMLKLLEFVDVSVNEVLVTNGVPHVKLTASAVLNTLLRVHDALSNAIGQVQYLLDSPPSAEVGNIESEMVSLLVAKKDKAREAIWSTLEDMRIRVLESIVDSSGAQPPRASPDIHMLTWSIMGHITFLLQNYKNAAPIVPIADGPQFENIPSLDSMIMEMTSCLEEKLLSMSELLPDIGLRFLFLINNLDFIHQRFQSSPLNKFSHDAFFHKIEGYTDSYLQASWEPVFSCLLNPTRLCFGKNYSQLFKFESEFQKTYTTQKLWKVPNPKMRKMLRKAITKKLLPGYEKYIEDNKSTTPKFTPEELEEMLEELFEG